MFFQERWFKMLITKFQLMMAILGRNFIKIANTKKGY